MVDPKPKRILVCGARGYSDRDKIYRALDAVHARWGDRMFLISGGATGADTIAREWAVDRRVDHITLYAKWDRYGRAAGPIRNRAMAKLKPKLVYAFHENIDASKGTADMIKVAEKIDVKVKRFH